MRATIVAFLFGAVALMMPVTAPAQKQFRIHSPEEIFMLMSDSRISYEVSRLEEELPCTDRSKLVNDGHTFPSTGRNSVNGSESYRLSPAEQKVMDSAEAQFMAGKWEDARAIYQVAAKMRPDYAPVLVYIGQTYSFQRDYNNAIQYLERAIALNYYSSLAHFCLSTCYEALGNYQMSVDELVMANILNRNTANHKSHFQRILPKAGYQYRYWCFEPQVLITRIDKDRISVKSGPSWIGYAAAKAAWKFEPGYRQASGGAPEGQYNLNEDKECLAVLVGAMENDTTKAWESQPVLSALHRALKKELFHQYLFYEVVLPKFPMVVYQLPKEALADIRKYILEVRMQ